MFALLRIADSTQASRQVRKAPKSDLCVDGDLGLTTRSEAAWEPPRFISRMLTGRRTSVHRQAWSWYRACTRWRCAPGSHPTRCSRTRGRPRSRPSLRSEGLLLIERRDLTLLRLDGPVRVEVVLRVIPCVV